MSYCNTTWISKFTYDIIYNFEKKMDEAHKRTEEVSRSIKSLEVSIEGKLISGTLTNNNWEITDIDLFKTEYIVNKAKTDFILKVELVNGDILEIPIILSKLSSLDVQIFNTFIPSTKDIKVIQVVNVNTNDVLTVDF